jgi:hypothetical protein
MPGLIEYTDDGFSAESTPGHFVDPFGKKINLIHKVFCEKLKSLSQFIITKHKIILIAKTDFEFTNQQIKIHDKNHWSVFYYPVTLTVSELTYLISF